MNGNLSVRDEALVTEMRDTMVTRGPDGAGLWVSSDRRAIFGHRRLSIIDLSNAAAQPMVTEDGRFCLVFNGEIYNHVELRRELVAEGVSSWRTAHSDTEVLLTGFARHGIAFVHRLRGMFAFAIWDARERELWLARDRVGIKPLYFHAAGNRIYFASEIKAMLKDQRVPRRLNQRALVNYLTFLVSPAPETMFDDILKLGPGTYMRFRDGGASNTVRYWDPLENARRDVSTRYEDLVAEAAHLVEDAVRAKSVSDVPVGVFLSGGLDSSTNAALFARQNGGTAIRTFSIDYDARSSTGYPSEVKYAKEVAQYVGARNDARTLSEEDVLGFIPRMIDLQDEPIGDPVCAPVFFVSELARKHGVIVCQVGEGADELLFGYPVWLLKMRLQKALSAVETVGGPVARTAARIGGWAGRDRPQGEALRRFGTRSPVFWGGADEFTEAAKKRVLGPSIRSVDHRATRDVIGPLHEAFLRSRHGDDVGQWMTYMDLKVRLPELLLMRVDKMSMGTSIEARVPFLDHHIVEWAVAVPTAMRTQGGRTKAILKDAMRGKLPPAIIDRKKQGFGVPVHSWVASRFGHRTSRFLHDFARRTGVFSEDGVRHVIDGNDGARLWYLLNVALWHERWIEGRPVDLFQA